MKVTLEYIDNESLVAQEIEHNVKLKYGDNCKVTVFPQNPTPEEYIKFGINELITIDQIEAHFDFKGGRGYELKINEIKQKLLEQINTWFDEVVKSNEKRLE